MLPRLKDLFIKEIRANLKEHFGYKNHYMVPEIQKVVLNMGLGVEGNDSKLLKSTKKIGSNGIPLIVTFILFASDPLIVM